MDYHQDKCSALLEIKVCKLCAGLIDQSLYNAGARRVAVAGLGALGCCPSQLRGYKSENGTCIGWLNDLAMDFNDHLRPQLFNLADTLPNATFAYQNLFTPFLDAVNNPARFGKS